MKKLLILSMVVSCLSFATIETYANNENVDVYLEGEIINFDIEPQVIDGRTMVPMRAIFEMLGASVEWDGTTQTIIGKKEETVIIMQIDNNIMTVNDEKIELDVSPYVETGRTLVPVRAIAESFGVNVLWYDDLNAVAIYKDKAMIKNKSLFNLKGEYVSVDENFEENYKELGWSEELDDIEKIIMYAPDGRTKYVCVGNVNAELAVGWYTEPVIVMYALDGRTRVTKQSEIEAYKKVGWYTKDEVMQTVYSLTENKEIYKTELAYYEKQGWRTSPFPITLTNTCSFEENSVNGIKLCWKARNTSSKTINYYTIALYFYNPVGDLAYDEITGKPYKIVKYVGPVLPNNELVIYQIVGYVGVCDGVVVGDIILEYDDGTSEEFWCGQVAEEGDILSRWKGLMLPEPSEK